MALLEVQGIRRTFGGLVALDGVAFGVAKGQIKSVIGPNGAGKTTLFNIISGDLRPEQGSVSLGGVRISGMKPYRIAEQGVARTFQNLSLFLRMTTLENVMIGRHCRTRHGILSSALRLPGQRREEQAIRESSLHWLDFVGLADLADVPVSALPFGGRRMVELGRALATEPEVLLLDEPASGLNTRETDDLARLICRIRDSGVTVLLVEHDMSLVMDISDEIVVLNYGVPIAEGDPVSIRANPDVVEVYLGGSFTVA